MTDSMTVYIVSSDHYDTSRELVRDAYGNIGRTPYLGADPDEAARGDWEDMWTRGDDSHAALESAIAYAESAGLTERHVHEVTLQHVRVAIRELLS